MGSKVSLREVLALGSVLFCGCRRGSVVIKRFSLGVKRPIGIRISRCLLCLIGSDRTEKEKSCTTKKDPNDR